MNVILLRGSDIYRRKKFWDKIKVEEYDVYSVKFAPLNDLCNKFLTPQLFGKSAYYIDDHKTAAAVTDFLVHNSIPNLVIIDQRGRGDPCYRRLARRFEVVRCDPIWAYKVDDIISWIYEVAKEMGVTVAYEDAQLLLENLGERSDEIVRALELHKLVGVPISSFVEYDVDKAIIVVMDGIARQNWDAAIKALIFLQGQGVYFTQVATALLTRYELLLKIKMLSSAQSF